MEKVFMEKELLLLNINRLSKKLKIKVDSDIRHLDEYSSLLIEVKASKVALTSGPNLVEIASILFSTLALLITLISLDLNVRYDTVYRFTTNKDYESLAPDISMAKFLYKEPYDTSLVIFVYVLFWLGLFMILVSCWYLARQIKLTKKVKKYSILEQFLEEYIKVIERKEILNLPYEHPYSNETHFYHKIK
ncbi:MAG: hypothetical protein ABS942_15660 [Solibacillus sp.]